MTRGRRLVSWLGAIGGRLGTARPPRWRGVRRADFDDGPDVAALAARLGEATALVLRDATLAPSGHNTQPWRVRLESPTSLLLCVEPTRVPSAVDPDRREVVLSLGAFLENAAVSAAARGRALELAPLLRTLEDERVARLTLGRGSGSRRGGDARIAARRTIRAPHATRPIPAAIVDRLTRAAGGGDEVIFLARDSPGGRTLADVTLEANRAQAQREDVQRELAAWLRWSDRDARAHRDGLTAEALELRGPTGWYVRHFFSRTSSLDARNRARAIEAARRQVTGCGGWLLFCAGPAATDVLEAGRRYQRLGLDARAASLALHPMSQALEEAPWKDQLAAALGLRLPPRMLVRAGLVDRYPAPVSLRRPLRDVVAP